MRISFRRGRILAIGLSGQKINVFPTVMHLSWGYNEPVILCWVERDAFTENYVFTHSFNVVVQP